MMLKYAVNVKLMQIYTVQITADGTQPTNIVTTGCYGVMPINFIQQQNDSNAISCVVMALTLNARFIKLP